MRLYHCAHRLCKRMGAFPLGLKWFHGHQCRVHMALCMCGYSKRTWAVLAWPWPVDPCIPQSSIPTVPPNSKQPKLPVKPVLQKQSGEKSSPLCISILLSRLGRLPHTHAAHKGRPRCPLDASRPAAPAPGAVRLHPWRHHIRPPG
jgi:hypothetical protein